VFISLVEDWVNMRRYLALLPIFKGLDLNTVLGLVAI
jgi:hypothetical protein